jgi:hypothetical protein
MAEKSFVNAVAETLGAAAAEDVAAALELVLELELLDELPHPTATPDTSATRAKARNRLESKIARSSLPAPMWPPLNRDCGDPRPSAGHGCKPPCRCPSELTGT